MNLVVAKLTNKGVVLGAIVSACLWVVLTNAESLLLRGSVSSKDLEGLDPIEEDKAGSDEDATVVGIDVAVDGPNDSGFFISRYNELEEKRDEGSPTTTTTSSEEEDKEKEDKYYDQYSRHKNIAKAVSVTLEPGEGGEDIDRARALKGYYHKGYGHKYNKYNYKYKHGKYSRYGHYYGNYYGNYYNYYGNYRRSYYGYTSNRYVSVNRRYIRYGYIYTPVRQNTIFV